jgi:hypothetical protein
MRTTEAIVDSIESRLRELNQEIETLTAARTALDGAPASQRVAERSGTDAGASEDGGSGGPARRPGRGSGARTGTGAATRARTRTRTRSRRAKAKAGRAVEVVPAGRLEVLLAENGGLTTSALTEQTNGDRDQVLTLLRELESAGRIRRSGQRRSTRWHAITDEDRINERAAELAARSRRRN